MADNDIIDFYKKADTDNKPDEPLKEQIETPEPVVSEAVAVPVPESNDPFDKFLFNLAEKLKTEKKITEQQQQQFNERIVQPTTNPEDPFAKFLESFAGLVKEDENINKEENIKEATIDFINKLKNDDFFDRDIPKVIPKVKQVKSKSKKYLPPKFAKKVEKIKEEQPVIEQSTEPEPQQKDKQPEQTNNPYLKELQTADKKKNKIEDKISGLSDIKKIIAQQVQEQLSKYPNLGFTGGGGGTNAVQYAEGGTMNGDLNVTGKYLSGGVDISTLFGSGGGAVSGIPDRLIAGSETLRLYSDGTIDFPNDTIRPPDETILTLESENPLLSSYVRVALSPYAFFAYDNEGNSITFDQVDNAIVLTSQNEHEWTFNKQGVLAGPHNYLTVNALSSLGRILSGGKDLTQIFLTSASDAQTLSWLPSSYLLSISNGNSVSLASLSSTGGGTGREDVNTIVISNSANWNTAYNIATAYSTTSGSFALSSHGPTHLNAAKSYFSGNILIVASYASFSGSLTNTGNFTIVADNIGSNGNSVYLYFDGLTDIDTAISNWNIDNSGNTITRTSGNGSQIPEGGSEVFLSGGADGGNVFYYILADNNGFAGNNIVLTFNGTSSINTVLGAWNSAHPTNTATIITGDGSLIPDSSVVTTFAYGADGIDPIFNQNLNTVDNVKFKSVLVNLTAADSNSPNNKLQSTSLTILGTDPGGFQVPSTVIKGGVFMGKSDGSIGMLTNSHNAWGPNVFEFAGVNYNISQYNNIYFTAGNFPQFWLDTSGNVGIRTAYPNERLTVNGNISATGIVYTDGIYAQNVLTITGSISGNNLRTSFNQGSATGNYSFAEGSGRATGQYSHAEGLLTQTSNTGSHAEGQNTLASGPQSHAEGRETEASGTISHAEGYRTRATGFASHAAGTRATAAQNYTYAWSDGNLGTATTNVSTTRSGQYMVSASGGVFFPGNVGIGTDSIANALTVVGTISTSNDGTSQDWGSASQNAKNYTHQNFFPLSGGTITGPAVINNNLTVNGNLTATGTTTFANTIFSVTSALSVVHIGSGPALYVGNNGTGDIASFYDIDQNVEVLHVGGINSSFPNVGVKVSSPNKTLTVAGEISATQDITTSGKFYIQNDGNSDQWNQAYNISTAYRSVSSSFATITFSDSKYLPLSGGTITGNLNVQGQILSGGINISQLLSSSGGGGTGRDDVNTIVISNSANWKTAYQNVSSQSLNTTDNVQFNQIGVTNIISDTITITPTQLLYNGNIFFSVEDSSFWYNGSASFTALGEWLVPISFPGPNAATNIAQTRTNLGLGSADNVQFNQVNSNVYLSGGVNLLDIFSGGGGGVTTTKKFDYVTISNIDYSYSGTAVQGTLETSPTWKLIRLTYANNGTVSNQASALNSWTGRLTASYITI